MTRQDILNNFSVDSNNVIVSPGKFENEMIYAPYFYDLFLNGCADDCGEEISFEVNKEDREQFPELAAVKKIKMVIDDFGSVYLREIYN